jgi:hypothetical protein
MRRGREEARGVAVKEEAADTVLPWVLTAPLGMEEGPFIQVLADEGGSRMVAGSMAAITGSTEGVMDAAIITDADTGMDMAD